MEDPIACKPKTQIGKCFDLDAHQKFMENMTGNFTDQFNKHSHFNFSSMNDEL